MENPLEPVAEDKEETVQDDSGELATNVNELCSTVTVEDPLGSAVQYKEETNQDDYREFATDVSKMGVNKMENALEHVVEEKEATYQDDYGELATELNEMFPFVIPSAPPLPGSLNSSPLPLQIEQQSHKTPELESSSLIVAAPMAECLTSCMSTVAEDSSPQALSVVKLQSEQEQLSPERSEKRSAPSSLLSRRSKSKSIGFLRVDTGKGKEKAGNARSCPETEEGMHKENSNVSDHAKRVENLCRKLFGNVDEIAQDREECFDSDKENVTPMSRRQKIKQSSKLVQKSLSVRRVETGRGKQKVDNARSSAESRKGVLEENNNVSEREKKVEKVSIQLFGSAGEKEQEQEEFFDSDKEKVTPISSCQKIKRSSSVLCKSIAVAEHANIDASITRPANKESKRITFESLLNTKGERSLITDQKRTKSSSVSARQKFHSCNVTTSSELEDLRRIDKDNQKMVSCKEMKAEVTSGTLVNVEDNEDAFPSDKENMTPQVSRSVKLKEVLSSSCARIEKEIIQKKAIRIPFQPLLEIRPQENDTKEQMKSFKDNCASIKDDLDTKSEQDCSSRQPKRDVLHRAEERKGWNIVVDANCFLDEQSRRSLQLLEGLKGSHLIIPRIVIRELDCLKRRESLFSSKSTTMASKALQWIEECMKNTSWWIHVQSAFEIMPVAPTPPISPRSPLFSDDAVSKSFSLYGSLSEIASPTADDHILDCALLFKKIKDGQFVILSNSTTLKIKAMAEGLSCETPEEFRESLVNPFSNRFLWAKSIPRGLTWSFPDDMGNSLHHQPVRKVGKSAEAVKGLKLILLHNTNYAQINSVN